MAKQEKTAAEIYREERKARIAKAAKKNSKKSISSKAGKVAGKVIAIVVAVAIVVGIGAFAIDQSGVIAKNTVAFTVGDKEVTQAEYSYYYSSIYSTYAQYASYGYSFGFDTTQPLSQQEYNGYFGDIEGFPEDETPTWADYFAYAAKQRAQYVKACVTAAEEAGLTLGEEQYAEIESTMQEYEEQIESYSESAGMTYSFSSYLKHSYGDGVSKSVFKKILEEQQIAQLYQDTKTNEFKEQITDKQINKEYKNNLETYGVVSLRSYVIKAETTTTTDEDGEETTTVSDEAMAAAKKQAETLAAKATSGEVFKTLVSEAEKANGTDDYKEFLTDDSLTLSEDVSSDDLSSYDDDFNSWAFGKDTNKNSTYIVENEDEGYTVYLMENPVHKMASYPTYDSRHILVMFEETETEDDSEETEETTAASSDDSEETTEAETTEAETTAKAEEDVEVETIDLSAYTDVNVDLKVNAETAKNKAGYKKAQDILEKYLKGEHTEEAFAALANEYTEDTGSNTNGGLYEGTKEGDFVSPYNDWCLEKGRKEGDIALVEYDGSNYQGYHIIYYVASGKVTWKDAIIDNLATEKLNDYVEEFLDEDIAKIDNVSEKAENAVNDFIDSLVSSSSSSYSY